MGYSFMHIEKIKSYGSLTSKFNHNTRLKTVANADVNRADSNETLVSTALKNDGLNMNFAEAVKNRIFSLPYYQEVKVRSNQVIAYEILLSFTKDDSIDLEKWKFKSIKWLHDVFDVAPDGKTNVINAEFHGDETGSHIHAIVCPIDERGHLNARRFTGGYTSMVALQTSYAQCVHDLGIERGVSGSSAKHYEIRKMYSKLANATLVPEVLPGESAEGYRSRIIEDLEARFAVKYRAADDYAVRRRQSIDKYVNDKKSELYEETAYEMSIIKSEKKSTQKELADAQEYVENLNVEAEAIRQQIYCLFDQLNALESEKEEIKKQKEQAKTYTDILKGIDVIRAEDPNGAEIIFSMLKEAELRAEEWEELALGQPEKEEDEMEI